LDIEKKRIDECELQISSTQKELKKSIEEIHKKFVYHDDFTRQKKEDVKAQKV